MGTKITPQTVYGSVTGRYGAHKLTYTGRFMLVRTYRFGTSLIGFYSMDAFLPPFINSQVFIPWNAIQKATVL